MQSGPLLNYDRLGLLLNINDNLKDWLIESVIEYQRQFERLADRTWNLPKPFFICCFLSGLQEDIKIRVQMLKPTSLLQTFKLARFQEEYTIVSNRKIPYKPNVNRPSPQTPLLLNSSPTKRPTPSWITVVSTSLSSRTS